MKKLNIDTGEVIDLPSLDDLKTAKVKLVVAKRQSIETAGFIWTRPDTDEGYFIATDTVSQGKIDAERKAADAGQRRAGDVWKCADPQKWTVIYPELSDSDIIDMSNKARDRICDCFNHEAELVASVNDAADETALALINIDTGWPA